MFRAVVLFVVLLVGFPAIAQPDSSETPATLLGFLKPGQRVGVQHVDGTTSVILSTFSERDYQLAGEVSKLGRSMSDASTFVGDHPQAQLSLDRYLAGLSPPRSSPEGIKVLPLIRMTLGRIQAIGQDYVMIELGEADKRKVVIARHSIAKVYLDASPLRFWGPQTRRQPPRVD